MIAVIGLIIGINLVCFDPTVPAWLAPFLPVAVVGWVSISFGAGGHGLRAASPTEYSSLPFSGMLSWPASLCWGHSSVSAGNDDGSCCRPWHPHFLQHGIDSPPTAGLGLI